MTSPTSPETLGLDPALLEIIVCPQCHGELRPQRETDFAGADGELVCQGSCGNAYPVRDAIPVLLVDEARKPA
jgi:uncharacterized protein